MLKILCLTLNTTHLKGALFEQDQIIASFQVSLSDYTPLFFSKLGIDLNQTLISFVLTETPTLYKESCFQKTPKSSLKKVISFYERSLFPLENNEAIYSSQALKIKKTLQLKSSICMKQGLLKTLDNLSALNLQPDYVGPWQPCLKKALSHLLKSTLSGLFIYTYNEQGYVLQLEQDQILFSTLLKTSAHQHTILDQALKNLPQTTQMTLLGEHSSLSAKIKQIYPHIHVYEPVDQSSDNLILLGLALSAQKGSFNFLKKLNLKREVKGNTFLQKLSLINLSLTAVTILTVIGLFCIHNHTLKTGLTLLENRAQNLIITQQELLDKKEHLLRLSYLSKQVPEVPSPLDLIAFLSNHPILVQTDHLSGKSAYCQELSYELIDKGNLKVVVSCYLPSQQLKTAFEQDLNHRSITFKTTKQAHLYLYELHFKKGYIF